MVFDMTGARVLITGAGSPDGIGFASARMLAQMGARLFLTGASDRVLDRASELRKTGVHVEATTADLTSAGDASELVEQAVAFLGGLDVVVNNAGMTSVDAPMHESGEAGDGA